MDIRQATTSYEKWIASCIPLDRHALSFKHKQMTLGLFPFLRATFYRWVQIWREVAGEAAVAPSLLAVGDLHLENFGTWRDIEGRLIWGINDFDEVYTMPYTMDLVRLATSAHAATVEEHLTLRPRDASDAILEGYRDALKEGGRPFVLAENHRWLRKIALNRLRDATVFWQKMARLPKSQIRLPPEVESELRKLLPDRSLPCQRKRRMSGLGSLGPHARGAARRVAWMLRRTRGQGVDAFGVRVGARPARGRKTYALRRDSRPRRSRSRSFRATLRRLAAAPPRTGLLPH
jgi:hypothetical protein